MIARREVFGWQAAGTGILTVGCVALGVAPLLVVQPLSRIAAALLGAPAIALPVLGVPSSLAGVPLVALLPVIGGLVALLLMRARRTRYAPTWACGY